MNQFRGEDEHNLDEKARLTIPLRHRDAFQQGAYLARGTDYCLWLVPTAAWEKITGAADEAQGSPIWLDRMIYSASFVELDRQGRLTLPPSYRLYAGLVEGHRALVMGVRNRLEIWNPDTLQASFQNESTQLADALKRLGF